MKEILRIFDPKRNQKEFKNSWKFEWETFLEIEARFSAAEINSQRIAAKASVISSINKYFLLKTLFRQFKSRLYVRLQEINQVLKVFLFVYLTNPSRTVK
jgi:hypothetical protein